MGARTDVRAGELQRLRSEHRELRSRLESLERQLERLAGGDAGRDETLGLSTRISDLAHRLRAHFAFEEEGGYLRAALEVAPHLGRRAERLRTLHTVLYQRIRGIGEAASFVGSPTQWEPVLLEFRAFAAALRTHEAEENECLREAFLDDHGGGD